MADSEKYEELEGDPSWWNRRSPLEKVLMLMCGAFVIVVTSLIVSLLVVLLSEKQDESHKSLPTTPSTIYGQGNTYVTDSNDMKGTDNLCLSPGCITTAAKVLERLDTSVDPCTDFYSFACGRFIKETNIPNDKANVNTFTNVHDKLQDQLQTLLTESIQENEAPPFKLAKNLFKLCMNKTQIEEDGVKELLDILNSLGGWPVLKGNRWDELSWSWETSVVDFRNLGFDTNKFFSFYITNDFKNSTQRRITISSARLEVSREYLVKGLDSPIVSAYYEYMVDMAVLLGANENRAKAELLDSLYFQIALANISLPREKTRNSTALYNPMTVKEFQKKYPYTNWVEYFNMMFNGSETTIDENEVLIVTDPSFMEQLGELLQDTPKRTMANYVMWSFTEYASFYLTDKLRKRSFQYSMALNGKQEEGPRWKECIDSVVEEFPLSVGALYIRRHFPDDHKRVMVDMVDDIKTEFVNILMKVDWMDDDTRAYALDKVNAMVYHIGYPEELMNDTKITEYYKDLEYKPESSYLSTILNMNNFDRIKVYNNLRHPVNKTNWITHSRATDVNAYYSPLENSIQFPAGILQGHFFSYDRPRYMNYGAVGYIIGHEITHGFDDSGRQFDKDGNLIDWWKPDTKKAYLEKTRCIIEQYGNYTETVVQLNLNGINTQGENIADNGGIKEAYNAYKKWVGQNGPESRLPGVDLTPEQMFWLSAAQTWCTVNRPEVLKSGIITGAHSTGRFRVIGPFSNMKDFSKDFNCPAGSPMNPEHKCEVW